MIQYKYRTDVGSHYGKQLKLDTVQYYLDRKVLRFAYFVTVLIFLAAITCPANYGKTNQILAIWKDFKI